MKEKELKSILDRTKATNDALKHYSKHIELLEDIVNYGSNLIVRALDSSKKTIEDFVLIGVLLKQVVQMVDAVQALLSVGATYAANLQTRAVFESYLYMSWIMKENSEQRAKYYYVAGIRKQIAFVSRLKVGTPERAKYEQTFSEFAETIKSIDNAIGDQVQTGLERFNEFLSKPGWKEINDIFKRKKHKEYDCYWYEALGTKSIRDLASQVGELPAYDIYYVPGSEIMHAGSYRDHIQVLSGEAILQPIRHLADAEQVIRSSCHATISSYINILKRYRFGELPQFKKKYINDWQKAFLNIPIVKYKYKKPN